VRHHSSEDLRVHSRDLEIIILPPRVECVDRVLQITVSRAVLACQLLPYPSFKRGEPKLPYVCLGYSNHTYDQQ
jgi:hypothetical protein